MFGLFPHNVYKLKQTRVHSMKKPKAPKVNNFVAKHMNTFNKPATHRDRTKYTRKTKHKAGY